MTVLAASLIILTNYLAVRLPPLLGIIIGTTSILLDRFWYGHTRPQSPYTQQGTLSCAITPSVEDHCRKYQSQVQMLMILMCYRLSDLMDCHHVQTEWLWGVPVRIFLNHWNGFTWAWSSATYEVWKSEGQWPYSLVGGKSEQYVFSGVVNAPQGSGNMTVKEECRSSVTVKLFVPSILFSWERIFRENNMPQTGQPKFTQKCWIEAE